MRITERKDYRIEQQQNANKVECQQNCTIVRVHANEGFRPPKYPVEAGMEEGK